MADNFNQLRKPDLGRMVKNMITTEKWEKLNARMESLRIMESDLAEHFIRGSGSGGQKINKTSSCVQLNHAPSGIEIRCQKTRSQADNRYANGSKKKSSAKKVKSSRPTKKYAARNAAAPVGPKPKCSTRKQNRAPRKNSAAASGRMNRRPARGRIDSVLATSPTLSVTRLGI